MLKKRLLSLMLSIAMTMGIFCSCSQESESTTDNSTSQSTSQSSSTSGESNDSSTIGAPAEFVEAPEGTPVAEHGQLSVNVNQLVDESGEPYQLRGMSTHGITWYPDYVCEESFTELRDVWKVNCIRIAMYVDENNNSMCYMKKPEYSKELMIKGINLCLELGLYVIVDWHVLNPGDPTAYTEEAKAFFEEIATMYSEYPNIIYELCNEPNGSDVTWNDKIYPYCNEVLSVLRPLDDDAVVIAGTGNWSQDINLVQSNMLDDPNVMYALHFYSATHGQWLMQRLDSCYNNGIPVFVSEFGCCAASGDEVYDLEACDEWLDLLDMYNVSYMNWALANKDELCCAIASDCDTLSGWTDDQLTEGGVYIKNRLIARAESLGE